ncbi:unnamed protein product, partial [Cyprideis torosa]
MFHLDCFLPTLLRPGCSHDSSGSGLWLNKILSLWTNSVNGGEWQGYAISLCGRLARENIGLVDWTPYLPEIFSRLLRCFIIPVRYGGFGINTELCESETTTTTSSNITEWIVSMFGNGQEAVWNHLEALLKSLNSFFHPSNSGPWERVLVGFLNN